MSTMRKTALTIAWSTIAALLILLAAMDRARPQSVGPVCGKPADILAGILDRTKEKPVWAGTTSNPAISYIMTTSASGSWTIVQIGPKDAACIVVGGMKSMDKRGSI